MHLSEPDWWKWGTPSQRKSLSDYPNFHSYLQQRFAQNFTDKYLVPSSFNTISKKENVELVAGVFKTALPEVVISTDEETRLSKSLGKSYADLLKPIHQLPIYLPDAVVSPASHDEVVTVLKACSDYNIRVVPFGGGSNVVGSFLLKNYELPFIVLDMSRMNALVSLDENNHTAVFQCGIYGPEIEKILNAKGYTLGHFPQSFEFSTLGGWVVTRSAGQESSHYGRIEDMAISLKVATPSGTITTSRFEGDAEGVNLKGLYFGSEGMFGVVTEAQVRIHRLPVAKRWVVAVFPSFQNGTDALRQLMQKDIFPSVVRYSDENETYFLSLLSHTKPSLFSKLKSGISSRVLKLKGIKTPSLMMVRMDGGELESELKHELAADVFRSKGALILSNSLGKKWEGSRFGLPYLRDDLMDRGIFVDTMETVLPWQDINPFKQKLLNELQQSKAFGGERGILLAHLSHVYTSSSSIYFTVITSQDKNNPYGQWKEIKQIVTEHIFEAGGAVSHHHSIGRDHQHWYNLKTDLLSREILKSVKQRVDPNNILNPGKLYDE